MRLIKPSKKYGQSWKSALREFEAEKRHGFWNVQKKPDDLDEYMKLTEDHARGKNLPDHWVQASTFWLIDGNEFVGHINVRHELNEKLKLVGGHIGYAIRPTARNKGYGSKILEMVLEKVKKMPLKKVLLTCDDSNIASRKIIEKNGGKLQDLVEVDGEKVRRYWIETE